MQHVIYHIIYHIAVCTVQIELMDADMVEYAIDMVHELDRTYGFPPKRTLSQVPVTEHGEQGLRKSNGGTCSG